LAWINVQTLAVRAAVLAAALSTLSALSGLILTALMLSAAGLALAALLLLAWLLLTWLLLAALLRIALLLLRVALRILLLVRHWDALHGFWKPPVPPAITRERRWRFLFRLLVFSATYWKIMGKCLVFGRVKCLIASFHGCGFPALPHRSGPVKTLPGIRKAADAWNISSSSSSTA
jgi:hypothetical protein